MDVSARLHAELRKVFGRKEVRLPFNRDHVTLGDAIDQLLATCPRSDDAARLILAGPIRAPHELACNAINPALILLVNDVDARLTGGTGTALSDGDVITLLPTIHGG
ncbi:MAG: MoaD/ThiS family protein [Candidatus Lokiarchaeota archaeon]|nr:MoaD/ThiS family protein [Candidatus Lokiarchaeota archaeon]